MSLAGQFAAAVDLVVDLGSALDEGIAARIFGEQQRRNELLSIRSRKWLNAVTSGKKPAPSLVEQIEAIGYWQRKCAQAESERDTARAALQALTAPLKQGEGWERLTYDEGYRDGAAALQARVERAVARVGNVIAYLSDRDDIDTPLHAIGHALLEAKAALEALEALR